MKIKYVTKHPHLLAFSTRIKNQFKSITKFQKPQTDNVEFVSILPSHLWDNLSVKRESCFLIQLHTFNFTPAL